MAKKAATGAPIVVMNPNKPARRRKRSKKQQPAKRKRRAPRRRNPTSNLTDALMQTGVAMLGGGIAYGVDYGLGKAEVGNLTAALTHAAIGTVGGIALGRYASTGAGFGLAGGSAVMLIGRTHRYMQEQTAKEKSDKKPSSDKKKEAAAVLRMQREGGAVVKMLREGGRAVRYADGAAREAAGVREAGARLSPKNTMPGVKRLDAGAMLSTPGAVRRYGPQSWAYDDVQVVSAHNR